MHSVLKAMLGFVLLAAAVSCGPQGERGAASSAAKAGPTDVGPTTKTGANTYANKSLGVTITAIDGWTVIDDTKVKDLMSNSSDAVAGDDKQLKAVLEASRKKSGPFFTSFKLPVGAPVDFNPSLTAAYENVSIAPGVKTGKDYFFHTRKLMERGAIPYVWDDAEARPRTIGGQSFDEMRVHLERPGLPPIRQSYYAARHGDMVVAFILSYVTSEEREMLDAAVDNIRLDW